MSIIEVEELKISYDKKEAVKGISFTIEAGEVVGFMGRNGAGKSSTLKVIGGVLTPTQGKVLIDGQNMSDYQEAEFAREIIGYCPDVAGLVPQATLREHIGLALSLHRQLDLMPYALEMVALFNLTESLDTVVSGFSHGMARRASIILAAISSFKVLILDEPFDGVDPLGVASVKKLVAMAKGHGVAVILSTHMQSLISETVDRVIIMSKGVILDDTESSKLAGESGVQYYENLLKKAEEELPS